ncbi:MAG: hypothetical protein QNJ38_09395 [Prochloraceae cyanobacterium]|nr:hypothetical protein [Prochloraceae cyanobacterium]
MLNFIPTEKISLLLAERMLPLTTFLAQQNTNDIAQIDIVADMQDAFNHFIQSGQVWALAIGVVLGYLFRSFTAY